jgi:hypothetical protein
VASVNVRALKYRSIAGQGQQRRHFSMEKNDETPPDASREAKLAPPSEPLGNSSDLEEDDSDLSDLDGGA